MAEAELTLLERNSLPNGQRIADGSDFHPSFWKVELTLLSSGEHDLSGCFPYHMEAGEDLGFDRANCERSVGR